jgi:hypothetical protein
MDKKKSNIPYLARNILRILWVKYFSNTLRRASSKGKRMMLRKEKKHELLLRLRLRQTESRLTMRGLRERDMKNL